MLEFVGDKVVATLLINSARVVNFGVVTTSTVLSICILVAGTFTVVAGTFTVVVGTLTVVVGTFTVVVGTFTVVGGTFTIVGFALNCTVEVPSTDLEISTRYIN